MKSTEAVIPGSQRRIFHKINVEITNVCNLKCSFCPTVERERQFMSAEEFEHILGEIAPYTEQVCLHLLGDPLVHPKLDRILDLCGKAQKPVFLVTNGVLLRDHRAELLLHPILRQVNFSLHSFHDNFPGTDPTTYLEKIFAYTERALSERPELYVNFRLWNLETTSLDLSRMRESNLLILERALKRFGTHEWTFEDVRSRKSYRLAGRLYLHFDTEFTWPSMDLPVHGEAGTCYGLRNHIGVLADGTVVPCCLDHKGEIRLGNLRESSLEAILSSPRAQAMRLGFERGKLVEPLCQRCPYIERFASNLCPDPAPAH